MRRLRIFCFVDGARWPESDRPSGAAVSCLRGKKLSSTFAPCRFPAAQSRLPYHQNRLGDTHCQSLEGGESMNERELELFRSLIGDLQAVSLDARWCFLRERQIGSWRGQLLQTQNRSRAATKNGRSGTKCQTPATTRPIRHVQIPRCTILTDDCVFNHP